MFKLVMIKDQVYNIVSIMGEQDMAHFVDMNHDVDIFKLPHIEALQRCETTERKVVYILKECNKYDIKLQSADSVEHVVEICQEMAQTRNCVSIYQSVSLLSFRIVSEKHV